MEAVPRIKAGKLQRARKTPTTIMREMTTGERPTATNFVGVSAAPSQAPAVRPESIPNNCSFRGRESLCADDSSPDATDCMFRRPASGSISKEAVRRPKPQAEPKIARQSIHASSTRGPGCCRRWVAYRATSANRKTTGDGPISQTVRVARAVSPASGQASKSDQELTVTFK
jgi:hypothetical protein